MFETIKTFFSFLNENLGIVTLFVGLSAYYLYKKQKRDRRRDAASLILQEIRYAERLIRNYKSFGQYKLAEKLLPTNSWNTNIHLFINDLKEIEIDLISSFYSKALYLDIVIGKISDHKNTAMVSIPQPKFDNQQSITAPQQSQLNLQQPVETEIMVSMPLSQKMLFDVSMSIEFIYNTPVVDKLRIISEKKWYQPF